MKKVFWSIVLGLTMTVWVPALGWAQTEEAVGMAIDTGDTTFILICAALVMLMTPGLALFYGGMSRAKNVLSTMMYCLVALGIVSIQWVLCGYSLAFSADVASLIGNLDWVGLRGVGLEPGEYAPTIPHQTFMVYQLMFAIITAAIVSGSVAERMRFPAFVLFLVLWTTLVYDPICHWIWGGGWLGQIGALDYAGGAVVHILSGVSGLVACLVIGKRKGYGSEPMIPHSLPMVVTGTALLWFGWFGFNAGSALAANEIAVSAFVCTHLATAAGVLSWITAEWLRHGKPTVFGAASGAIAGLGAITPAAGFVSPVSAIAIGLVSGMLCYWAVSTVKKKLAYDDSFDAFGVHGVGGTWGVLATGIFANPVINGEAGLLYGNPNQLVVQLIAVAATWAVAAAGTLLVLKAIGLFMQLRATDEEQELGLDLSEHGEDAYTGYIFGASPLNKLETATSSLQGKTLETQASN